MNNFRLTNEELTKLSELTYLGNYVISCCRTEGEEPGIYDEICDMLYTEIYLANDAACPTCDIEDNELADIRDRIAAGAEKFLRRFEDDVISSYSAVQSPSFTQKQQ